MAKIGLLFAGQGSQYKGMGHDLYDKYETVKRVFDDASKALGFDVAKLCFEENDQLNVTEFTQPAIVTMSVAILELLKEKGINYEEVAGLSLGEYTAVYASGACDFAELVRLVNARGRIMQSAVPDGIGKMAVILGLEDQMVLDICNSASTGTQTVEPANYNCPGQVVVGGHIEAVDRMIDAAKANGAKRALELAVSVPSHTSIMNEAAHKFGSYLEMFTINKINLPLYANVTGEKQDREDIKDNLTKQMSTSTYMGKTIENMINSGVDTFIEIGPGKALTGFVRKVAKTMEREVAFFNVENVASLDKTLEGLGINNG